MFRLIRKNPVVDLLVTIATAIAIAFVVQLWFVKPFQVPSASMQPTLAVGDYILGVRFLYHFTDPKRGSILVFHPNGKGSDYFEADTPAEPYFVKRLIGLPNEVVGSHDGKVYVCADGRFPADPSSPTTTPGCRFLDEPYVHGQPTFSCGGGGDYQVHVPPDHYLMLGDNRTNSLDGRCWGTIPRRQIVGRAFLTYWPLTRISLY